MKTRDAIAGIIADVTLKSLNLSEEELKLGGPTLTDFLHVQKNPNFNKLTRCAGQPPAWGVLVCKNNREHILIGLKKIEKRLDEVISCF